VTPAEFTAPAPEGSRPVEYASFGRRLGAALLDSAVWIVGLTFFPIGVVSGNETAAAIIALLLASAWFNYFAICEWRWGQTIGKNAVGIRVLPLQGGRLTWQAAALRNLLRIVELPLAYLGIEYMIVSRSPRRQRLGDRAAKTIVVREHEETGAPQAAEPAAPRSTTAAAPTAAELFGDAAEALARHPAAGSAPKPTPESASSSVATAAPPPAPALEPARWSAPGFPFATWGPRRGLAGLFLGLLAAAVAPALLLVIPAVAFDIDLHSTGAKLAAQGLSELALAGTALMIAGGLSASPAIEGARLGLRRVLPSFGFGLGVQAIFAYSGFSALAAVIVHPEQQDIARDLGLNAGVPAAITAVVLIAGLAPIAEEIFFRGMLFGGLRKRLGMYSSAAISALIFGALHATTGVTAVPQLAIFGFVLALLYERTGSVLPGICVHMLNNSLALIAAS
jgi:membrane protease YdiL (CAAX protease family)/uncharacterized RDD family membrane protein YckC